MDTPMACPRSTTMKRIGDDLAVIRDDTVTRAHDYKSPGMVQMSWAKVHMVLSILKLGYHGGWAWAHGFSLRNCVAMRIRGVPHEGQGRGGSSALSALKLGYHGG